MERGTRKETAEEERKVGQSLRGVDAGATIEFAGLILGKVGECQAHRALSGRMSFPARSDSLGDRVAARDEMSPHVYRAWVSGSTSPEARTLAAMAFITAGLR